MAYENILLEKEDRLAILYINRPKALNALNAATLLELKDAIAKIGEDADIDVLIVTGAGDKSFVA
ncbi:MAG TPA: crotonase, partial [Syntrophomonas sp.]|nr:crotonase [Syntrophomonas sp.]